MIWVTRFIVEAYRAPPVLYTSAAFVDRSRWTWFLECFDVSSKHGTNMVSHSSYRGLVSNADLKFCRKSLVGVLPALAFANWKHVADGESIALDYWWISDVLDCFVSNMLSRIEAMGLLGEQVRKQVLLCNGFLRSWSGYIPISRGEDVRKEERISANKLKAKRYPRALLLMAYHAPPTKTTFGY